ncbi:LOW QUALITY PROTEIN: hypothetical protein V2J09_009356 [Rumex salicifolius]
MGPYFKKSSFQSISITVVSSAGTGFFCMKKKNPNKMTEKLEIIHQRKTIEKELWKWISCDINLKSKRGQNGDLRVLMIRRLAFVLVHYSVHPRGIVDHAFWREEIRVSARVLGMTWKKKSRQGLPVDRNVAK